MVVGNVAKRHRPTHCKVVTGEAMFDYGLVDNSRAALCAASNAQQVHCGSRHGGRLRPGNAVQDRTIPANEGLGQITGPALGRLSAVEAIKMRVPWTSGIEVPTPYVRGDEGRQHRFRGLD